MEPTPEFNSWSFFSGMLVGMVFRWSDLLPMMGGFLLGISVTKIPEIVVVDHFPRYLQHYAIKLKNSIISSQFITDKTNLDNDQENNELPKLKLKPKKK